MVTSGKMFSIMSWDHIELSLEVKVQKREGDSPKPSVAGAVETPPSGFCGATSGVEEWRRSGRRSAPLGGEPISETSWAHLETCRRGEQSLCLWSDLPKTQPPELPLSLFSSHSPVLCVGLGVGSGDVPLHSF